MADLTVEILKEIRDELRTTRAELSGRIDQTNARIGQTNERLDSLVERQDRLERHQTQMEIRLATELVAVVGAVNQLKDAILEDRQLRATVSDHENRLRALERQTG